MANVKAEEKKDETLEISQFFTMENEENGVWFEAMSGNIPTGIEFLVYGPNSKKAWMAGNKYIKALDALEEEPDDELKHEETNKLLIETVVARCGGIRGKNGKKLKIGDKEVGKEDIKEILSQAPLIALSIWKFCQKADGFLDRKKKN